MFFRAIEVRWPESYYGLSDLTSYRVSLRLGAYLAFRFLPVIVVCFFASVLAISLGSSGLGAAMVTAVLHGASTAGRAAMNAIRRRNVFARRLLFAAHIGIATAVLVAGLVGGVLGQIERMQPLVPRLDALVDNVWTAIIAGIFGAYLVQLSARAPISVEEIIRQSTARLPEGTLEFADQVATESNVDPMLVRSLLLVENLQRPSWVRNLERAFSRFFPVGSYGLMQVQSDHPLSDEESIRLAVATFAGQTTLGIGGALNTDDLTRLIRAHNGNQDFVQLATSVYWQLLVERSDPSGG